MGMGIGPNPRPIPNPHHFYLYILTAAAFCLFCFGGGKKKGIKFARQMHLFIDINNNIYHKIKKSSSILYLQLMNTKKIIILT